MDSGFKLGVNLKWNLCYLSEKDKEIKSRKRERELGRDEGKYSYGGQNFNEPYSFISHYAVPKHESVMTELNYIVR